MLDADRHHTRHYTLSRVLQYPAWELPCLSNPCANQGTRSIPHYYRLLNSFPPSSGTSQALLSKSRLYSASYYSTHNLCRTPCPRLFRPISSSLSIIPMSISGHIYVGRTGYKPWRDGYSEWHSLTFEGDVLQRE